MGGMVYLDTVLLPVSLFLMIGYHVNLWRSFKITPTRTSVGVDSLRRRSWFLNIKQGDANKKGTLAVQSLRNALMDTILTATVSVLVNLGLAALITNAYKASHLFNTTAIFGSQSGWIFLFKYGSACTFLLVSFLCSSMGFGFLIDANFLINASGGGSDCKKFSSSSTVDSDSDSDSDDDNRYTEMVFERGFVLAFIGNRSLCMAFPLLLWMLGPLPLVLSSVALVWGLYEMDFASLGKFSRANY